MAFEHYDKCSLLLPMDGANNGTVFDDWSHNPKTVTANGNAKTVTAQSKYYGSSGAFDGTGDYLTVPNTSAVFDPETDFTIAAWVNCTSTDAINIKNIATTRSSAGTGWWLGIDSGTTTHNIRLYVWSSGSVVEINLTSSSAISNNTFEHIAAVKESNVWTVYLNGINVGSGTQTNPMSAGHTVLTIGRDPSVTTRDWLGNMQDFIIVNEALWTENFTPPPRLIGELSNASAANPVEDESGTPVERRIFAVPRCYPTRMFTSVSDVNGDFTLRAPATECSVFAIHEGSPVKNDLIHRVTPV